MSLRRRFGFTMIELLVVIAIIAVLIALLLPAVQAAREAARRCQCINNLMQVGIAIHNYQVSFDVLPPGTVDTKGPVVAGPPGYQYSWMVQILPYMEQKNLYKKFDFKVSVYSNENDTTRSMLVNSYLCPSDPVRGAGGGGTVAGAGVGGPFLALTSYKGVHHDAESQIDVTNNGLLYLNSAIAYDDIEDGASNTMLVGEARTDQADLGWASGTRATLRNTGSSINRSPTPFMAVGTLPAGILVQTTGEGMPVPPKEQGLTAATPQPVGGFSSFHNGGANFLMGDGAVRFMKNTITSSVQALLANRHDGEAISADSY